MNRRTFVCVIAGALIAVPPALADASAWAQAAAQTFSPDQEGFIRNWLVLAPIALGEESGASEIDRDLIGREAERTPKAGDRINVGGRELAWTAHQSADFMIDFLASFGQEGAREFVAAYAVAYVTADEEMALTLAFGSNDQGKAWVNGTEVAVHRDPASLERDATRGPATLVKGQNVLVFKVINEVNNWQGCLRFFAGERPVTNLTISLTPS